MNHYPEMRKILPILLEYYKQLIPAQHMGTVGEHVPVPNLICLEIEEMLNDPTK